jgi:PPOX class probable F420-dependent enzyme
MTRDELRDFLRRSKYAVVATTAADGSPQSAVVGIAVSDACEIVFDTLSATHKTKNLRRDPRIAVTVWEGERTAQLEGVADEPSGAAREAALSVYFVTFPDGRERLAWPGITHFRVRPRWARYSDFSGTEAKVEELSFP